MYKTYVHIHIAVTQTATPTQLFFFSPTWWLGKVQQDMLVTTQEKNGKISKS